jgi:hypothetical protein
MYLILPHFQRRWDTTVSEVIKLLAIWSRVSTLAGARDLSIFQNIQTRSAADHLLPLSAEIKNHWNYTSNPPIGLNGAYNNKFTFPCHILKWFYYVPATCFFTAR